MSTAQNKSTAPSAAPVSETMRCGFCKLEKPLADFWVNNSNRRGAGITYRCKSCHRLQTTKRRYRTTLAGANGETELNRLLSETEERLLMLEWIQAGQTGLPEKLIEKHAGEFLQLKTAGKKSEIKIKCSVCGLEKPLTEFHANHANPRGSGVVSRCKPCQRIYQMKQRYEKVLREKGAAELKRMESEMQERIKLMHEVLLEKN